MDIAKNNNEACHAGLDPASILILPNRPWILDSCFRRNDT